MPILGTIASSTRQGLSTGSYEFIATATASGSSVTVTFSSIPQTYKHLELRYVGRNSRTAQEDGYLGIKFNSTYPILVQSMYNFTNNNPSELSFGPVTGNNNGYQLAATGGSTNAASMGTGVINIPDYTNTAKLKMARVMSAAVTGTGGSFMSHTTITWNITSAITSIDIYGVDTSNIAANSKFSLYGLKAS
jgi:hypothetical protein